MSSQSQEFKARDGADLEVRTFHTWTDVLCKVDSTAGGTHKIGFGNGFTPIESGDTFRFMASPGSKLKFRTTSSNPVSVSFIFTELSWIDQIVAVLCRRAA